MGAVMYDDDKSTQGKAARKAEKDRSRLLNSEMMAELRYAFSSFSFSISVPPFLIYFCSSLNPPTHHPCSLR
jgi:hypothetical protein